MEPAWPGKVAGSLCSTCGKELMVGVFNLTEMPVSAGMGVRCLAEHAEPFRYLRLHVCYGMVNGVRDQVAYDRWLDQVNTYVDGGYMSLREAVARYPITEKEVERQKSSPEANRRKAT